MSLLYISIFLILVLETESLERKLGMLETQRESENTSNIFPLITISPFLSQDYVLFSYDVEKAGSCFCNVHIISRVWRVWRLRRRWSEGDDGSCGRPAGFLTCQGAAVEMPGHEGGRQSPRAATGRCVLEGVNVGAATRHETPFMPWTRTILSNCSPGSWSFVWRCHIGPICISLPFAVFGRSQGCSAEQLTVTEGGVGSWTDAVALAPADCDRGMAPQWSLLGNIHTYLHTCPARKRGGDPM